MQTSNLSPMGLTRDSVLLYLTAVVAAAGFLATMPPPTQWTYMQWLQVIGAAALWLIGKLQTSPLVGKDDADTVSVATRQGTGTGGQP